LKFKNLPGLILEVQVNDKELMRKWLAEKVVYSFKEDKESNL